MFSSLENEFDSHELKAGTFSHKVILNFFFSQKSILEENKIKQIGQNFDKKLKTFINEYKE